MSEPEKHKLEQSARQLQECEITIAEFLELVEDYTTKKIQQVIGEDEPEPQNPREESGANWNRRIARNEFRAELRAKAKGRED